MESNSASKTNQEKPLVIYKASAGSGKTYTLAYRYIKMLLGVKAEDGSYHLNKGENKRAHSHILAITFTNKATAEMKSRIIKELDRLGYMPQPGEDDSPYAKSLVAELGCKREELATQARYALNSLLMDYNAFNISTIDAFFQTILRTFAREIDRQGDFKLELDAKYVLAAALSLMLDDVNNFFSDKNEQTESISEWLKMISKENMDLGREFNPYNRSGSLYRSIIDLLENIFNEDFDEHSDALETYLDDHRNLENFKSQLEQYINDSKDIERAKALDVVDAVETQLGLTCEEALNRSVVGFLNKSICQISDDFADKLRSPFSNYIKALITIADEDDIDITDDKYDADGVYKAKVDTSNPTVNASIQEWFKYAREAIAKRCIFDILLKEIKPLRAIGFIKKYIKQYRQDNNLILLADTNSLLKSIISEDDTPFIYERVGVELKHFLIDEFQDTSQLQWDNIMPLLSNSLAEYNDSLIIGDVKQSIYRWRGANSELLNTGVYNKFPQQSEEQGANIAQNSNYRSAHDIVKFNNTLFRRLANSHNVGGYGGLEQGQPGKTANLTAHIVVRNFGNDAKDDSGNVQNQDVIIAALEEHGLQDKIQAIMEQPKPGRTAALHLLAKEILDQHKRGYQWREISILVRRRDDAVEIADFLMENYPDIKLVSDEALLVNNCNDVKQIVNILEMLEQSGAGETTADPEKQSVPSLNPEATASKSKENIRRATMMMNRFEYFYANNRDMQPSEALAKALDIQDETVCDIDGNISKLTDDLDALRELAPANLSALVEAIIMMKIPQSRRAEHVAYLLAFMDIVEEFSENFNPTIHSFLDYWHQNESKLTIAAGNNIDAVTIMTVHKAKGLQWPCVHIPLMNWELEGHSEDAWYSLDQITDIDENAKPPIMWLAPSKYFTMQYSPFKDAVLNRVGLGTADNLNVLYVAFTRAEQELHISLFESAKRGSHPASIEMIKAFNQPNDSDPNHLHINYNDSLGILEIGSPTTPYRETDKEEKPIRQIKPSPIPPPPINVAFTSYNECVTKVDDITANPAEAHDPDIGNEAAAANIVDDNASQEAAKRGSTLHAILAEMFTRDDLEEALRRNALHHTRDEIDEYRAVLAKAFDDANDKGGYCNLWFSADAKLVLNEQPIYLPDRDENLRPDRIVWTSLGTIDIIDYKFTSEITADHEAQVKHYANLLSSMGLSNIRAFIWRPEAAEIRRVR